MTQTLGTTMGVHYDESTCVRALVIEYSRGIVAREGHNRVTRVRLIGCVRTVTHDF